MSFRKIMLAILLGSSINCFAMNDSHQKPSMRIYFDKNEVRVPARLGPLTLYKDDDGFHVIKDNVVHDVNNHDCSQNLQTMSDFQLMIFLGRRPRIIVLTPEQLAQINPESLLEISGAAKDNLLRQLSVEDTGSGYILVNQYDTGEYHLQDFTRGLGGAPGDLEKKLKDGAEVAGNVAATGIGSIGGGAFVIGYLPFIGFAGPIGGGAAVGASLAASAVATVASPIVIAVGAGYGAYALYQWVTAPADVPGGSSSALPTSSNESETSSSTASQEQSATSDEQTIDSKNKPRRARPRRGRRPRANKTSKQRNDQEEEALPAFD